MTSYILNFETSCFKRDVWKLGKYEVIVLEDPCRKIRRSKLGWLVQTSVLETMSEASWWRILVTLLIRGWGCLAIGGAPDFVDQDLGRLSVLLERVGCQGSSVAGGARTSDVGPVCGWPVV